MRSDADEPRRRVSAADRKRLIATAHTAYLLVEGLQQSLATTEPLLAELVRRELESAAPMHHRLKRLVELLPSPRGYKP
ncbi:MAG: hypothetical protein H6945_06380 [Zoogloeaceae bacterium]|nr:hypothetical protein [Zoogloeaceae bacterium]